MSVGILVILVTCLPVDNLFLDALAVPWNEKPGDVLIVLAAESVPDLIGRSTYWRCVYAVRVWREGGFKQVLVSGGTQVGNESAASQMRRFLISQGVPDSAIVLEAESVSTHENAVNAARLLSSTPGRKVLLTSDFHMRRALGAFRKAGLDVVPHPVPDLAKRTSVWTSRWDVFNEIVVEEAKTATYWIRGWI